LVGWSEGSELGENVGLYDGWIDGLLLGCEVGWHEGCDVGAVKG